LEVPSPRDTSDGVGFREVCFTGATALGTGRFLDMIEGAFSEAVSMLSRALAVELPVSVVL
jgi:hypothetical protein